MNIKQLISADKLSEAIQILIDQNVDGALLLMARLESLERQKRLGIVSNSDANIVRNQIRASVLECAGETTTNSASSALHAPTGASIEKVLLRIVAENKRRRSEIANEAQAILNSLRQYHDTKTTTPSHDPTGRRLNSIHAEANSLIQRLESEKGDALESIVARIAQLLKANVPEYTDLQEAYTLAVGRGFQDHWVATNIAQQPNDTEVRISIAERIEAFTAHIMVA